MKCGRRRIAPWIAGALLMGSPPAVSATVYETARDDAIAWLATQQGADGSWGGDSRLRPLLTHEVVEGLRAANLRNSAHFRGITWFENHGMPSVDAHARRILSLAPHGDDLQTDIGALDAALAPAPGGTSGWGLSPGYAPSILDTALALEAYAAANLLAQTDPGLSFLLAQQQPGGGWPVREGLPEDPITTSVVLRVLAQYRGITALDLEPAISAATGYLTATVDGSSSQLRRAHAALALLREDAASSHATVLLDSLLPEQDPVDGDADDGSWGPDVYTTAVVVRALGAKTGSDDPTLAQAVLVEDFALRSLINQLLNKNVGDTLTVGELRQLQSLDAEGMNIASLAGLEQATNLQTLNLRNNAIEDLGPIEGLAGLQQVFLYGNSPLGDPCDLNGDALVDIGDGVRAVRLVQQPSVPLADLAVADVAPPSGPGDGSVGAGDVLLILRAGAGETVAVCTGN